ncbi:hypothetical protein K1719_046007 [Acacia pycnantha]|nr:hypothetical protein K1719_046007 [Acacia pycnantha]
MGMAGTNIVAPSNELTLAAAVSGSSTPAYSTQPMRYHVFLSFRGPDTRKTFTDHLYSALVRKGIVTFRDDEEIEKGEAVKEKLSSAIQQSRYCIIVLSQEFASSRWCLEELQEIVETKPKQTVLPVFMM